MVGYSCWNGAISQYLSCFHKDNAAVDLVMVRVLSRSYRVACPDSNFEGQRNYHGALGIQLSD